jgi:hypothetical protein
MVRVTVDVEFTGGVVMDVPPQPASSKRRSPAERTTALLRILNLLGFKEI